MSGLTCILTSTLNDGFEQLFMTILITLRVQKTVERKPLNDDRISKLFCLHYEYNTFSLPEPTPKDLSMYSFVTFCFLYFIDRCEYKPSTRPEYTISEFIIASSCYSCKNKYSVIHNLPQEWYPLRPHIPVHSTSSRIRECDGFYILEEEKHFDWPVI